MISPDKTILIIIDVQERLLRVMPDQESLCLNLQELIQGMRILNIPIVHTEQAPDKIGSTVPSLAQRLSSDELITKTSFSCWQEPTFQERIKESGCRNIILAGVETHVCLYQTAMDLKDQNYAVQVVADAVSSRIPFNTRIALDVLHNRGIGLTTVEMILMELVRDANHPKFKDIVQLIK